MVKQNNENITSENNKQDKIESTAIIKQISELITARISLTKANNSNDDLIGSLSDAYENKRARQVFEWENVRRQSLQRAM